MSMPHPRKILEPFSPHKVRRICHHRQHGGQVDGRPRQDAHLEEPSRLVLGLPGGRQRLDGLGPQRRRCELALAPTPTLPSTAGQQQQVFDRSERGRRLLGELRPGHREHVPAVPVEEVGRVGRGRCGPDEEVRWDLVGERDVAGEEVCQIFGRGRLCEEVTC